MGEDKVPATVNGLVSIISTCFVRSTHSHTKPQVNCQKLLSFIPCSDLLSTCRGCLNKLRTIRCSYGWTNYFCVFFSHGEHQRRFLFCAASDEWDLIRQCDRAINFPLFFFVSKIMSYWFSLRIFLRPFCCALCGTSEFCRCPNEISELLKLRMFKAKIFKLCLFIRIVFILLLPEST